MSNKTTFSIATDASLAASYTSPTFSVSSWPLFSVHWWISSGSATGSLTIQVSDYEDSFTDGYGSGNTYGSTYLGGAVAQWVDLVNVKTFPVANAFTALAITASSPAGGMFDLDLVGWKWMRVVYTRSSGSGTMQIRGTGKRNKTSTI